MYVLGETNGAAKESCLHLFLLPMGKGFGLNCRHILLLMSSRTGLCTWVLIKRTFQVPVRFDFKQSVTVSDHRPCISHCLVFPLSEVCKMLQKLNLWFKRECRGTHTSDRFLTKQTKHYFLKGHNHQCNNLTFLLQQWDIKKVLPVSKHSCRSLPKLSGSFPGTTKISGLI